jgi:hypothetical protein
MSTTRVSWDLLESDLAWDGSWCNLYVHVTAISEWKRFLDWAGGLYPTELLVDTEVRERPSDASTIFSWTRGASVILRIKVQPLLVVVHLFSESEIEMTVDPREVHSQRELDALVAFMHGVAGAVGKPVEMSPENGPEYPILTVAPNGAVKYHEPQGGRAG